MSYIYNIIYQLYIYLLVLLDEGQVLVDVLGGSDHEGHPLVEGLGLDVQHPLGARGGHAPRLLNEEGDGVALVQQPQLLGKKDYRKTRVLNI